MAERDLDVVVFGATGITGRQVAAYLAERGASNGVKWAAAGRSLAKLKEVLAGVGVSAPETIVADLNDAGSLAAMAQRTRVVLNLAGPYTLYGRPVIEACVANGAHYVDLSGEIPFVSKVIEEFDAAAREAAVKVVQVCGFEALPPDLAVLLAAETARERWDEGLDEVDLQVSVKGPSGMPRPSDMISGGTFQSLAAAAGEDNAAAVADPAALITDMAIAAEVRRRSPITLAPRRSGDAVVAPMAPAAFINPAVVHRTAQLDAEEHDRVPQPFTYREGVALEGGPASLPLRYVAAGMLSGTQAAVMGAAKARPAVRKRVGRALGKVLPSSGFGPTGERMENWSWRMSVEAKTTGAHEVGVKVGADGHPGYLATARMMGEAGLLLAEPSTTPDRAGCLTPATALGTGSLERLTPARVWFSVAPQ